MQQNGRSMVEMLGVLAVIGILSVSALDDLTVDQIVDYCNYKIREEKTYNFWIEWK